MASTHTTRARVVAAAVRFYRAREKYQMATGRAATKALGDMADRERELQRRTGEHLKADRAERRVFERNRRGSCGHTLNKGDMMDRSPCTRLAGHDGRHKNMAGERWE